VRQRSRFLGLRAVVREERSCEPCYQQLLVSPTMRCSSSLEPPQTSQTAGEKDAHGLSLSLTSSGVKVGASSTGDASATSSTTRHALWRQLMFARVSFTASASASRVSSRGPVDSIACMPPKPVRFKPAASGTKQRAGSNLVCVNRELRVPTTRKLLLLPRVLSQVARLGRFSPARPP
jgi:hypothetical protein